MTLIDALETDVAALFTDHLAAGAARCRTAFRANASDHQAAPLWLRADDWDEARR